VGRRIIRGASAVTRSLAPSRDSLEAAYRAAERIASHGLNNLYRTSCYFEDPARYASFCAFYAIMRLVDDRVDGFLADGGAPSAARAVHDVVDAWHAAVRAACSGLPLPERAAIEMHHPEALELHGALSDAHRRFPTPVSLWDDFFSSMHQDLERARFATYEEFVSYAKGAAIAPATIYLYLISAERDPAGDSHAPPTDFDLQAAGHKLGLFAYIAHILRDLAEDLTSGGPPYPFIAGDDMAAHGLTEDALYSDLAAGSSGAPLTSLVRDLAGRARLMAIEGRGHMRPLVPRLSPDRAFVLELIVRIYERTLERILHCECDIMSGRHVLTDADKTATARAVAAEMGYALAGGTAAARLEGAGAAERP
jgi:phytoene/squalene synthetase